MDSESSFASLSALDKSMELEVALNRPISAKHLTSTAGKTCSRLLQTILKWVSSKPILNPLWAFILFYTPLQQTEFKLPKSVQEAATDHVKLRTMNSNFLKAIQKSLLSCREKQTWGTVLRYPNRCPNLALSSQPISRQFVNWLAESLISDSSIAGNKNDSGADVVSRHNKGPDDSDEEQDEVDNFLKPSLTP
jgi:hypothetical protein